MIDTLKQKHADEVSNLKKEVASLQEQLVKVNAESLEQKESFDEKKDKEITQINEVWSEKLKKLEREKNMQIEELRHQNQQLKVQMDKEESDKSVDNLLELSPTID